MQAQEVAATRLAAHRLIGPGFESAVNAVGRLGAVQAQDYPAAKWALALRLEGATEAELDAAFDRGDLLRTHVLRPTWHFVLPADVRWMQELTGPRLLAGSAGRWRQLELDRPTVEAAASAVGDAIAASGPLTRAQLAEVLRRAAIAPDGQRLPHLLNAAEHLGVVTSGPRRDRQLTYALRSDRAPGALARDRDDSLRELALRYFPCRGPARLADFVWWSGLTAADARRGIELAGARLERSAIGGVDHWSDPEARAVPPDAEGAVHLLPNFDEYTVAYRHRGAVLDPELPVDLSSFAYFREAAPLGAILSSIVTVGGRLRGAWSRRLPGRRVTIEVRTLARLTAAESAGLSAAAERYAAFLGRETELIVSG